MTAEYRHHPVLIDHEADARLAAQGFVVVDIPQVTGQLDDLADRYGRLHGWHGEGFEPDLTNTDLAYRAAADQAIASALDPLVDDVYLDGLPFIHNFLCKWPGEGSDLYLHRDWMYVDESAGDQTFVTWIPVDDVGLEAGPLQFLVGSHRIDPSLRGTNLNAPWIQHRSVIDERLVTVTVQRGQAVVLNNAVVHSSLPNTSGKPRLVAAVVVRPRSSTLVHYHQGASGPPARYDVDESFFTTTTPQGLMAEPPHLSPVSYPDGKQMDLDPAQLARLLDSASTEQPQPAATRGRALDPLRRWVRARRRG